MYRQGKSLNPYQYTMEMFHGVHIRLQLTNSLTKNIHDVFYEQALTCTGCGSSCRTFTTTTGSITDGSGTNNYPNNAMCQWLIAPTGNPGYVVYSLTSFAVQNERDWVRFFVCLSPTCDAANRYEYWSITGSYTTIDFSIVSVRNNMVQFDSDGSGTDQGFALSWTAYPVGSYAPPPECACGALMLPSDRIHQV
jgi:hypothetical protein